MGRLEIIDQTTRLTCQRRQSKPQASEQVLLMCSANKCVTFIGKSRDTMVAVPEHTSYFGIRIQLLGPKSWGRMNEERFFTEFTGLSARSWFLLIVGHRVVGLYTLSYMSLYSVQQFAKSFHIHSLPTLVWPIWDGQKRNDHLRLMGWWSQESESSLLLFILLAPHRESCFQLATAVISSLL